MYTGAHSCGGGSKPAGSWVEVIHGRCREGNWGRQATRFFWWSGLMLFCWVVLVLERFFHPPRPAPGGGSRAGPARVGGKMVLHKHDDWSGYKALPKVAYTTQEKAPPQKPRTHYSPGSGGQGGPTPHGCSTGPTLQAAKKAPTHTTTPKNRLLFRWLTFTTIPTLPRSRRRHRSIFINPLLNPISHEW